MKTYFQSDLKTLLEMCEDLDSPRSLSVYLLAKSGEWVQYLELDIHDGLSAADILVSQMLSKHQDLPLGVDKEKVALDKFEEAEAYCALTNARFADPAERHDPIVLKTRKIIARILGPVTRPLLDRVVTHMRFGPGATSACSGISVNAADKYACDMHMTSQLRPYARSVMGQAWATSPHGEVLVLDTSSLTTVPKNAKTNRCIAIEPHGNIYVQLGIGAVIRNRLLRAGVDLDNGADRNRQMAQRAWSDRLATIDLSSASDTIAYAVVKMLLPADWFQLLSLARTPRMTLDLEEDPEGFPLEKFSSMGNGFTFELESLIFYSVCLACGSPKSDTAVFGDDIIVPQSKAGAVIEALEFLGFRVNTEKTFVEGNFYESCGTDWHYGFNVRPFFLKGDYYDPDARAFYVCNAISRWNNQTSGNRYRGPRGSDNRFLFRRSYLRTYSAASRLARQTAIPHGTGDSGFARNLTEAIERDLVSDAPNGLGGFVSHHRPIFSRVNPHASEYGRLLYALARVGPSRPVHLGWDASEPYEPTYRGLTGLYRPGSLSVHSWQWTDVQITIE